MSKDNPNNLDLEKLLKQMQQNGQQAGAQPNAAQQRQAEEQAFNASRGVMPEQNYSGPETSAPTASGPTEAQKAAQRRAAANRKAAEKEAKDAEDKIAADEENQRYNQDQERMRQHDRSAQEEKNRHGGDGHDGGDHGDHGHGDHGDHGHADHGDHGDHGHADHGHGDHGDHGDHGHAGHDASHGGHDAGHGFGGHENAYDTHGAGQHAGMHDAGHGQHEPSHHAPTNNESGPSLYDTPHQDTAGHPSKFFHPHSDSEGGSGGGEGSHHSGFGADHNSDPFAAHGHAAGMPSGEGLDKRWPKVGEGVEHAKIESLGGSNIDELGSSASMGGGALGKNPFKDIAEGDLVGLPKTGDNIPDLTNELEHGANIGNLAIEEQTNAHIPNPQDNTANHVQNSPLPFGGH